MPRRKRIRNRLDRTVPEDSIRHLTRREIAAVYGVSLRSVYRWLHRVNREVVRREGTKAPAIRKILAENPDKRPADIADMVGCTRQQVYNVRQQLGLGPWVDKYIEP